MLTELSIAALCGGALIFLLLKNKREAEYHKIRMVTAHLDHYNGFADNGPYRKLSGQEVNSRFEELHHDKLGDGALQNLN